jgi:hypothetical protein
MKINVIPSKKLVLLSAAFCAAMLVFSHNAGAVQSSMPPSYNVPDGGSTVMLLGAALGALGMARRFLMI